MALHTRPGAPSERWVPSTRQSLADRFTLQRARRQPRRTAARLLALGLVLAAVAEGFGARSEGHRALRSWGQTTAVVVAERSLARGEAIATDDVRVETWPRAVAPSGAAGELDQAVGEIVVEPVRADEPVALSRLESHQASRGRLGLTGDEVAVALVGGLALPPLEIDDRVELYPVVAGTPGGASGETVAASGTSGGRAVEGRIVAVSPDGIERSVTVAVPRPAVTALIEAQAMGVVEIVLVG